MKSVPKLCGADIELGNFILGRASDEDTCREAAARVLGEIDGRPLAVLEPRRDRWGCSTWLASPRNAAGRRQSTSVNPQDWARRYLPANGGCAYIDMDHLELCLPEVLSAADHVACWHALLRIVQAAQARANERLPPGERVQLMVNNSDGFGHSYGSHLNVLVTRETWDRMLRRKVQFAMMLAAYQTSSILFTGQGKVGAEREPRWGNGHTRRRQLGGVEFQISQRADFFEQQFGTGTTSRRPLVNRRDEPLCGFGSWRRPAESGPWSEMARAHVIFYDATLAPVASYLKIGVLQIILAMIEGGFLDRDLILDDPVEALHRWSRDLSLDARARTAQGQEVTALDLQWRFLEHAKRFAAAGEMESIVPGHASILALWEDTLRRFQNREMDVLARRIDWVLKLSILQRAMERRPELDWASPEIKHLDQIYGNLDPNEGLYWAYEKAGRVERVVSEERIKHFTENPPNDTRAWGRARLLRLAPPEQVDDVNWDAITFARLDHMDRRVTRCVSMPNPLGFAEAPSGSWFDEGSDLTSALDRLGVEERVEKSTKSNINDRPVESEEWRRAGWTHDEGVSFVKKARQ